MSSIVAAAIVWTSAAGPAGIGNDPFSRASDVLHYSFVSGKDDKDYDGQPDDWTRRQGPGFPTYVNAQIDDKFGRNGKGSLRFDVNGGAAIYYSPPKRIDALHAYVFEGYIRTQRLNHDAAMLSLSFLNHRRQRVQRVLSVPVSGTHKGWVRVRLGPIFPKADVKMVVVGCHLVNGTRKDLRGRVWFDDLRLGRIPQLTLVRNLERHFKSPDSPVKVTAMIGGLDPGPRYRLKLGLFDQSGKLVKSDLRSLATRQPDDDDDPEEATPDKPITIEWSLPPQPIGFYTARASLQRDKEVIIEKSLTFVVNEKFKAAREGIFGWSIGDESHQASLKELVEISGMSGISQVKYSVWRSTADSRPHTASEVIEFFNSLAHRRIQVTGVLGIPPKHVRSKFPRKWSGVREVFLMPRKVWWPTVEPTIARFSGSIRHWQFGAESDLGFTTVKDLPKVNKQLKTEFDAIARDIRVGVPWSVKVRVPRRRDVPHSFFTFVDNQPAESKALEDLLSKTSGSGVARWISIQPLSRTKHKSQVRAGDLVKRLVMAKAGGAEAIFAHRLFDPEYGLLNPDGSPTELFLTWRAAVDALRGAEYLGALRLQGGSRNFVFDRDGEGIVVLWSKKPTTEELNGAENATVQDAWGRTRRLSKRAGSNKRLVAVDSMPRIVRGCSAPVLRWILSTRLEVRNFESRTTAQQQALLFVNPFPQGVNGKVKLIPPKRWQVQPRTWDIRSAAGERVRLPMTVKVPDNVSQGTVPVRIEFEISADRPQKFEVLREFRVVMGDMAIKVEDRMLPDGRLEIRQTITNNTQPEEVLSFRCTLLAPNVRRQRRTVTKLGRGKDRRVYFLRDAAALRGKTLQIRAEQIGGNRLLNLRWKALGEKTRIKPKKKKKGTPKTLPKSSGVKRVPSS